MAGTEERTQVGFSVDKGTFDHVKKNIIGYVSIMIVSVVISTLSSKWGASNVIDEKIKDHDRDILVMKKEVDAKLERREFDTFKQTIELKFNILQENQATMIRMSEAQYGDLKNSLNILTTKQLK